MKPSERIVEILNERRIKESRKHDEGIPNAMGDVGLTLCAIVQYLDEQVALDANGVKS